MVAENLSTVGIGEPNRGVGVGAAQAAVLPRLRRLPEAVLAQVPLAVRAAAGSVLTGRAEGISAVSAHQDVSHFTGQGVRIPWLSVIANLQCSHRDFESEFGICSLGALDRSLAGGSIN